MFIRHNNLMQRTGVCGNMLRGVTPLSVSGRIVSVSALVVEVAGLLGQVFVGDQLTLHGRDGGSVRAEVSSFRNGLAQVSPSVLLKDSALGRRQHCYRGQRDFWRCQMPG
jgi:hypothetical protein